jgi:transposase
MGRGRDCSSSCWGCGLAKRPSAVRSSASAIPEKRSVAASERDEWSREAWKTLVAGAVDTSRLVFVDEMGANTSLCPLYAYSPRGRRAHAKVPRNRGKNTTLLASMTAEGMGPCVAVEGTTAAAVFEAYVEQVLVPTLRTGQAVGLDNLSSRKGGRVREMLESRGCKLLFLPPYSPDLNSIEEAFSKVKGLLRQAGARMREALIEAKGQALGAVTNRDARGFFEHCGYRSTAQPLCQLL